MSILNLFISFILLFKSSPAKDLIKDIINTLRDDNKATLKISTLVPENKIVLFFNASTKSFNNLSCINLIL